MKNILIDAERTRYVHTGLYHFCKHLLHAIANQPCGDEYCLSTYAPEREWALFNKSMPVVKQYSLHKFYQPFLDKFQLIHSTFQGTNYFPFCLKGKVLLTVHDLNFLHEGRSAAVQKKCLTNLEKKLQRADSVVAISGFVKSDLLRHTSVSPEKVKVIHNGCNILPGSDAELPPYRPSKPFFFTIGTVVSKKNFHVLPAMLLKNDFELVIAGILLVPEYVARIMQAARDLGVEDRVHIVGPVSEPEKIWYLQHCQAFAFPSIAEGFGLPVIEAMHFGKPVVLSTHTSLPEVGGKEAYYFEGFDSGHIASKTMEVLDDYARGGREKMRAIMDWSANFNWGWTAEQYLNEYKQLLA
jgi:glycosyltransferase involved in cell wall biosynthesis